MVVSGRSRIEPSAASSGPTDTALGAVRSHFARKSGLRSSSSAGQVRAAGTRARTAPRRGRVSGGAVRCRTAAARVDRKTSPPWQGGRRSFCVLFECGADFNSDHGDAYRGAHESGASPGRAGAARRGAVRSVASPRWKTLTRSPAERLRRAFTAAPSEKAYFRAGGSGPRKG